MPRLTGTVRAGGTAADGAYVQLRNLTGDFVGEVRTDTDGTFVLHPGKGRWRLVSWLPGRGQWNDEVEIGAGDLQVEIDLGETPATAR